MKTLSDGQECIAVDTFVVCVTARQLKQPHHDASESSSDDHGAAAEAATQKSIRAGFSSSRTKAPIQAVFRVDFEIGPPV